MIRLLLSIVALLLALPASAAPACHEPAPVSASASMHHHGRAPDAPAAAPHDCLGCVPPVFLIGGVVAAPWHPTERLRAPMRDERTAGAVLDPLSPPPRAA